MIFQGLPTDAISTGASRRWASSLSGRPLLTFTSLRLLLP